MTQPGSLARSLAVFCLLLLGPAHVPAQILGKGIGKATESAVPQRPEGRWRGTARESVDGTELEYGIELEFRGSDDALQLDVRGTAKVPAEGRTLTVTLRARYAGSFRGQDLAMRSEAIDVRVVETGQQIPSSPQRVEAKLRDGVLRAGSAATPTAGRRSSPRRSRPTLRSRLPRRSPGAGAAWCANPARRGASCATR